MRTGGLKNEFGMPEQFLLFIEKKRYILVFYIC
jgi:hypothetical protein